MSVWRRKRLGEIIALQRGYDLPEYERSSGSVPVYGSFGITGYHDSPRAPGPGVTVGRSGASFGVVNYCPVAYWPHNTVLFVTDFKGNDPRYVSYLLKTIDFSGFNSGSAQPSLNRNFLYPHEVNVPCRELQERMASILSAYDDLIENNTRRIRILEEMAQMIHREWFVALRFPGHENARKVESELGPIPEGWSVEQLEPLLAEIETGNRPKGGVGGITQGIPSLGAESILGVGKFDYTKTKYVPVEYFEKMNQGHLRDRDVLVYKDGGQPGNFHPHVSIVGDGFPFSTMSINSHVYRLRGTERVTQDFLYYHLSSDDILDWMRRHGTGSAIPGLARKDLLQLPIILPPIHLLTRFDDLVRPLTSLILNIAKRNRNLRTTRDLLLPKLISGEVPLEAVDKAAAEFMEQTA